MGKTLVKYQWNNERKIYFNKLKNVNSFTEPFFVKTYY